MIQALLAFIAALVVALGGALYMVRSSAADATEARLEAASQAAINASQQATAKVTDVSTTKLAQARTRIYTEIKEVIREVPVLIPAGSCDLPPGFRVLHDAAAGGPLPAAASGPDAAPVPLKMLPAPLPRTTAPVERQQPSLRDSKSGSEG